MDTRDFIIFYTKFIEAQIRDRQGIQWNNWHIEGFLWINLIVQKLSMLLQKVFHPISRHKTKKEMSSVVFICLQEGITSKVFLSQYRSSVRTVHLILARFFLVALLTLFPNFFFFLLLYSITETSFLPSLLLFLLFVT